MTAFNKLHTIQGRVINSSEQPIPNLRIEAWDKDRIIDDFLAEAETDELGNFILQFGPERFKELPLDTFPDVYFKIYFGKKLIKSTMDSIMHNLSSSISGLEIIVEMNVDQTAPPPPPIPPTRFTLPDDNTYTVSGNVFQNGKPLANATIEAFDQDLPSKKNARCPLGKPVTTNKEGRYSIEYREEQFKRAENRSADVVLTVRNSEQKLLHTTQVQFNAPRKLDLDIRFETENERARMVEFKRYEAELTLLLDGEVTIEQLTSEDLSFLTNETEIPSNHLQAFHQSFLLQAEMGVEAPFFYALLRQSLSSNLATWAVYQPTDLVEFYEKSAKQQIVEKCDPKHLHEYAQRVLKISLQKSLETPLQSEETSNQANLGEILGSVISNSEKQLQFLELYHGFQGDRADFWKELRDNKEFGKEADQLAFTLQLSKISANNQQLIRAIQMDPNLNQLDDLVALEAEDWQQLILKNNAAVPSHVFGKDDAQKAENYAKSITGLLESSFPNEFVAKTVLKNESVSSDVIHFLQNKESGFSITRTPVDAYLRSEEGMEVFGKSENPELAVEELKTLQRLYSIAGESKLMQTLMNYDVKSAHQLASMPVDQYMQVMSDSGIETQTLLAVHAQATQKTETNLIVLKEVQNYYKGILPKIMEESFDGIEGVEEMVIGIPDYETLFGSMDSCDCGHCRSVYSATAYFVELLHELLGGKFATSMPSQANPIRRLFARRPDLQYIKLTCENTETEIPYIDVVNEILETYVGTGILDEAHTRDTSSFTAEELAANPQFIVEGAHATLRDAIYPISMPFDLHLETAREYFNYLGSRRDEVLRTFLSDNPTAAQRNAYLAESISLSEREFEILTEVNFAGGTPPVGPPAIRITPQTLYGYPDDPTDLGIDSRVKKVATFLEKCSITYDDLLALLKTTFINPLWHVADYLQDPTIAEIPTELDKRNAFVAANPGLIAQVESSVIVLSASIANPCDLDQTNIVFKDNSNLDDEDFAKINRFIRLWKKLGCSIEETDLLLTAFGVGGTITAVTIERIAQALLVNRSLNLPIENLVSLWGNMPHVGKTSVYHRLFLNKAALKIDDKFILNTEQSQLADGTRFVYQHIPALLAAFKVSEEEIAAIRKLTNLHLDTAVLSIANISTIYRYTVLAKAAKLTVLELVGLLKLMPSVDPFNINDSEETLNLIRIIGLIKQSNFSFEQLRFLYQSQAGIDAPFLSKPEVILQLAKTMGEGLDKLSGLDEKKNFVRSAWSTAFRLGEKTSELLLSQLPNIEANALALTSENVATALSIVADPPPAPVVAARAILTSFTDSYNQLNKIAILINGFKLKAEELEHFVTHPTDFDQFALSDIPLTFHAVYVDRGFNQWLRLANYSSLKKRFGVTDDRFVKIFAQPDFQGTLTALQIATNWYDGTLKDLMGEAFGQGAFSAVAADYRNEKMILKFVDAYELSQKMGLSIKKLSLWTQAVTSDQSMDIKNTLRSKYEESQWFEVAKNVNNPLREKNRDALVSYLLTLDAMITRKIHDTNDLYAYFLIDVEMQSCMMTSRIVQANASIQLFVQRCLMNLELDVRPSEINEKRWKWMKKYRVWEANRKVFLYPENWIEPELRDGKSPFFKELESTLLQGEVNQDNVEKALKTYLNQLDEVANLKVRAMYEDTSMKELHVVARTENVPHVYYYRKFSTKTKVWTAWKKVETDIEGDNLCMIVWNKRLMLFWLSKTEKANAQTPAQRLSASDPQKYLEYKLNWSEYKQENWLPKKMSKESLIRSATFPYTFMYPRITNNALEILCGMKVLTPENSFWFPDMGDHTFAWEESAKFIFESCQADSSARTSYEISLKVSRHNDEFEELIGGYGVLGISEQSGLKKILDFTDDIDTDTVLTQTHIPRFVPGDYFFVGGNNRSYFVKTDSYYLPVFEGPIVLTPLVPILPEFEQKVPYQPWNDDPRPGFDWEMPFDYSTQFEGSILVQSSKQIFQDKIIGEAAAPMMMTMKAMSNERTEWESSAQTIEVATDYKYNMAAGVERYGFGSYLLLPTETSFQFFNFYHAFVCDFMKSINTGGVDALLTIGNQKLGERNSQYYPISDNSTHFKNAYDPQSNVAKPYPHDLVDFSESGAYSLYNWELFFHVPMLIANRLSKNQRFDEAMHWYHFIFNPMSTINESSPKRFWNVLPFKITPKESIQQLLAKLQLPDGNADKEALKSQIEQWRDNPFNPHLLARMRLMAYMKNTVMKYLDNLISWGDNLFQRETRESVMEAIQIYMLAGDILGKKPTKISMRGKTTSESYNTLKTRLDAFQNAAVNMETFFPNYSESSVSNSLGSEAPNLTNVVQTFFFCIPDNEKLLGYWDKVADRLFKIRNCQNIDGLQLKLSLFEPPIDPALLVQATAQGLDLGSVLADIPSSSPLYKFQFTLQKAMEFTNELRSIGAALLTAVEKKDAEEFSILRTQHESVMLQLAKETKKMQYLEAVKNRENILKTRDGAVARWQHYSKLLGVSNPAVPAFGATIKAIAVPEDAAGSANTGRISSYEGQDLSKASQAAQFQLAAGMYEAISGLMHAIPNGNIQPLGMGATFGGANLGAIYGTFASGFRTASNMSSVDSARASKLGGFFRREQDWTLQCNAAANEIMAIDKQILTAEIRIDIAAKERENHDKQIENSQEVEAFMKSKFSNSDLYGWMQGELATVYFQTYQMAFDLAKKAELSYRHELGIETSNFIQFGYWDSFKKGLLAGDKLALSLRQLEKAYMESNKREYEITKHVSLASLDPLALIKLKTTGVCDFEIPEALYDLDNPGHYFRRIKSVSVSLPCIAGPYTSVNAKLSLGTSRYRKDKATTLTTYNEVGSADPRFKYIPSSAEQCIATSHGQNDSGVFELNFRDERYVPFEGAGAISNWNLELPTAVKLFDYNTIADVVMHIKYTAREGGSPVKNAANNSIKTRLNDIKQAITADVGMHHAINLTHDMPNEWHLLKSTRSVNLRIDKSRLPYLVQALGISLENVQFVAKVKNTTGIYKIHLNAELELNPLWGTQNLKIGNSTVLTFDTLFTLSIPASQELSNLEELMLVVNYKFDV